MARPVHRAVRGALDEVPRGCRIYEWHGLQVRQMGAAAAAAWHIICGTLGSSVVCNLYLHFFMSVSAFHSLSPSKLTDELRIN